MNCSFFKLFRLRVSRVLSFQSPQYRKPTMKTRSGKAAFISFPLYRLTTNHWLIDNYDAQIWRTWCRPKAWSWRIWRIWKLLQLPWYYEATWKTRTIQHDLAAPQWLFFFSGGLLVMPSWCFILGNRLLCPIQFDHFGKWHQLFLRWNHVVPFSKRSQKIRRV